MSNETRRARARGLVIGLVSLLVFGFLGLFVATRLSGNSTESTATTEKAQIVKLEDPGPGRCAPDFLTALRKEKPGKEDFVPPYSSSELTVLANREIDWVAKNESKPCVRALASSFGVTAKELPGYYRSKLHLAAATKATTVQNSYYSTKDGHIIWWVNQTFPKDELLWYDKDGNPVAKYVCLNRTRAPKKVTPPKAALIPSHHKATPGSRSTTPAKTTAPKPTPSKTSTTTTTAPQPTPSTTTKPPTTKPPTTTPPSTTTPPTTTTSTGKQQSEAPKPPQVPVTTGPAPRAAATTSTTAAATSSTTTEPGKGSAGPGATSTTTAPPTSTTAPAPPVTVAPTSAPPMP